MWFQSSFRQLSGVQMRQVGAIVGAAIGDAAVASHNGTRLPFAAMSLAQRKKQKVPHHSAPYEIFLSVLRCVDAAEGVFTPPSFHADLLASSELSHSIGRTPAVEAFHVFTSGGDGRLVEGPGDDDGADALCAAIPLVALYPWISDDDMPASYQHLWNVLDVAQRKQHALPYFYAGCGVLARHMSRNPAPIRNTALSSKDGQVRHVLSEVSEGLKVHPNINPQVIALPSQTLEVLRWSADFAARATTFEDGILMLLRRAEGRGVGHAGLYLGALLGAKFGTRALPLDWLEATHDAVLVSSMALTVSQHAWNPNRKGAGLAEMVTLPDN